MKKLISIKALLLSAVFFMISCNEDMLNYPDPNNYTTANYFNTPSQIRQAANAMYVSFIYEGMMGFQWSELFDVPAVEAEPTAKALPNEKDMVPIWQYVHLNTNKAIYHYWRMLYRLILRSNLTIDKAQEYIDENGDDADHIVSLSQGEGYFIRGYAYFCLALNFGKVPMRTSFDQAGNEDAPRAESVDIVWAQAEEDLKAAQNLLPDSWDAENLGRPTKGSATGFLGKLYLFNEKYSEADTEFAKLDGKYSLLPLEQYLDNFGETNENNQESIYEVQFAWNDGQRTNGRKTPEGNALPYTSSCTQNLYGWNDWANWKFPEIRVKDFIYNDENGVVYQDPRAYYTFYGGIGDNTWQDNLPTGPVPFDFAKLGYWYKKILNKENKVTEGLKSGNNVRLMRYADVLLMRAECSLFTGDINGCIDYINQVRSRIGAFTYLESYDQTQAFELLKRERQLELMGEQHRFDDLRRWGILRETINPEMQELFGTEPVLDKHYLFPIPQQEIDSNLGITVPENEWN